MRRARRGLLLACLGMWLFGAVPALAADIPSGIGIVTDRAAAPALPAATAAIWLLTAMPDLTPNLWLDAGKEPHVVLPLATRRPFEDIRTAADSLPTAAGDACAAARSLAALSGSLGLDAREARTAFVLLEDARARPCDLEAGEWRLHRTGVIVLALAPLDDAEAWKNFALGTKGRFVDLAQDPHPLESVLRALNGVLDQAPLDHDGARFAIDHTTTKLTILARALKGRPVQLQAPNGRMVDLNRRLQLKDAAEHLVLSQGDTTLVSLRQPPSGPWTAVGADTATLLILSDSKQRLVPVLTRTRFLDSEELPVAVYLTEDGQLNRTSANFGDLGCQAGLTAKGRDAAAGASLLDDGRGADVAVGDGIFSARIPLKGLEGRFQLSLTCRSSMFVGSLVREVEVVHGALAAVETPKGSLPAGERASLLITQSDELPASDACEWRVRLNDEDELGMSILLNKPGQYAALLPAVAEGPAALDLTRECKDSPLLRDLQHLRLQKDSAPTMARIAKLRTHILLGVFALLGAAAVAGALYLLKRRRRIAKEKTAEEERKRAEAAPQRQRHAAAPPISAPLPEGEDGSFKRLEPDDDEEVPPEALTPVGGAAAKSEADAIATPTVSQAFVSDVSDRLGEVVSVHAQAPVKADLERPDVDPQSLDHDGDSSRVSDVGFDSVKSWLDDAPGAAPEASSEPDPAVAAPSAEAKEAAASPFSSRDIFGSDDAPASDATAMDDSELVAKLDVSMADDAPDHVALRAQFDAQNAFASKS